MPPLLPFLAEIKYMTTTAIAAFAGVVLAVYAVLRKKRIKGGRRMSFNSQVMVHGAFPPEAEVAKPIINIVMMFKKCPDLERLKVHYTGLTSYDRFRAIPLNENGSWIFRNVDFDIDNHVHCSTAENEAAMKAMIDSIVGEPLRTDIPYWCVHRIETRDGLSCVVTRLHHVIADGISLVAAINKVFCDENNQPLTKPEAPINTAPKVQISLVQKLFKVVKSFFDVLYIGISPYDSDIKYTAPNKKALAMTTRKTLYFPSVKLAFIKALKEKAGVTVNDILLAATSGAIRRYSQFRGDDFSSGKQYRNRALVPLAFFRPMKDLEDPAKAMSNKFAFLSVDLPINSSTAVDRVNDCNKTMSELKTSPIALVQLWVQSNLLSFLPLSVQRQIGHDIFSRHSIVFSNVPGPSRPITLAGEKVVNMQVLFPNLLPQVILISYSGSIFNCMVIDDKLITNPEKLCEYYLEDLREVA
ncbi:unnamed protein product, partial [Ectocarpus fasciculatus]